VQGAGASTTISLMVRTMRFFSDECIGIDMITGTGSCTSTR
jgi:hypothetical protein